MFGRIKPPDSKRTDQQRLEFAEKSEKSTSFIHVCEHSQNASIDRYFYELHNHIENTMSSTSLLWFFLAFQVPVNKIKFTIATTVYEQ